jgi:hypothetical protein
MQKDRPKIPNLRRHRREWPVYSASRELKGSTPSFKELREIEKGEFIWCHGFGREVTGWTSGPVPRGIKDD